ncbi:complex I subunit 5 family protein [Sediminivirga luteola]|uniref:Cation:proton antiporter n=1 Tax=Sediminivirga luteola TaxID=1774748 RepID=A0A8J2U0J0_9MICO|nr:proton-conducting transporter membrane subunit [Sediminivirga luteola]MCI2265358.1 monovalent cation/H+ antiporter subunit D family protein [Sediminivirga luteola]GGA24566.1 cation:proton antiporter [Sediminivirga luteola]
MTGTGSSVEYSVIPYVMLLTSLLPGLLIFTLREEQHRLRIGLNLAGALAKIVLVVLLIPPVVAGSTLRASFSWAPGLDIVFTTDPFSLFFVALSSGLWLLTTIYAIGYLEDSPNRSRFFGFFSLCVTATVGIALAGNLLTFLIFYELLTLATYPLVAHRGTTKALRGARTYLAYTLSGGVILLLGVVWLTLLVGPVEFTAGGVDAVAELAAERPGTATAIGALLLAGMGVKAALFPLHGWLPIAMVAPAPVSALLHAVAVVKAGAFGIVRVVHDTYGPELSASLGLLPALAGVAGFTIVYGSVRALTQDDLKKRLAFSTVSQLSYVALGAALVAPMATTGALVHIVHQGIMKITLFFCAGLFAEVLGRHRISELDGAARRMPLTALVFTIAALGMIGLPPTAGFLSKWALGAGALDAGQPWVLGVLLMSTALNAAYFLPVIYRIWLPERDHAGDTGDAAADDPGEAIGDGGAGATADGAEEATGHTAGAPDAGTSAEGSAAAGAPAAPHGRTPARRLEAPAALLLPALVTGALVLLLGIAAGWDYSPWTLARMIAETGYGGEGG